MRKDPPFDLDYYFATLLLERARGKTLIINDPRGLREQNEKLTVLDYPGALPADDRHARGEPPALVPGRAGGRDGGEAAGRVRRLRRVPRPPGRPQHGRHPGAGDQPGPALDDGAEVPARGAARRQAHPAGATASRCARCCACRRPTTRAATCTWAPSRWRPSSTSATWPSSQTLGPQLRERGHFFVGLDVIGGFLTEINVTSPTGILEANALYDDAYEVKVVEKLEQKIAARSAA